MSNRVTSPELLHLVVWRKVAPASAPSLGNRTTTNDSVVPWRQGAETDLCVPHDLALYCSKVTRRLCVWGHQHTSNMRSWSNPRDIPYFAWYVLAVRTTAERRSKAAVDPPRIRGTTGRATDDQPFLGLARRTSVGEKVGISLVYGYGRGETGWVRLADHSKYSERANSRLSPRRLRDGGDGSSGRAQLPGHAKGARQGIGRLRRASRQRALSYCL